MKLKKKRYNKIFTVNKRKFAYALLHHQSIKNYSSSLPIRPIYAKQYWLNNRINSESGKMMVNDCVLFDVRCWWWWWRKRWWWWWWLNISSIVVCPARIYAFPPHHKHQKRTRNRSETDAPHFSIFACYLFMCPSNRLF